MLYPPLVVSPMDPLESRLLHLECHFTWALREEDFSLHDLVNRLEEQIELELKSGEARVTRAYSSLAFVWYLYGDLDEALKNLHKSEDLAKQFYDGDSEKFLVVTYGDFAWLYFHMENVSLAEEYLKKVDGISGKFGEGSTNEVLSEVLKEKGWAFLKFSGKYYNGATECFRQALELNPDDSDLNAGYAITLYRTTIDPPGSCDSLTISQLRRAILLNPEDAVLLVLLALRLIHINWSPSGPQSKVDPLDVPESVEAIRLVVKALTMSPENPHVMRYVAQFCRRLGSVDFAICQLEKTLIHTPDSAFIHHQLALCYKTKRISITKDHGPLHKNYEAQNCLQRSIYHLKRAVSLKPIFIVALAELALQYGQIGSISKAEDLFQQAFQLAREKKEHLQAVHAMYGQFQLYSKGSEQSAIYYYMEGLRLKGDGQEWTRCENELADIARHRSSRKPEDSKSYAIEGFIHELKGEKQLAEKCYKKALTTGIEIGESPLLTELRVWLLAFKGTEKSARNVILGSRTPAEEVLGIGRPVLLKGMMVKKTVSLVETDLCNARKILPRERSLLAPGPHAIVLAFLHEGQLKKSKSIVEDLEIFGKGFWRHVVVLFTSKTTSLRGNVSQWLLQKCGDRYYIAGTGSQTAQTMEFSDRIMNMIFRNKTMHLVIPSLVNQPTLQMVKEPENGELFTPEVISEMGQSKYRFLCRHAGWFYCSFTQLGFRMNGEGEVVYRTVDEDSSCPVTLNQYAAGPLYDVTCVEGHLSQLQLPHCEISPDHCPFMTVGHYTDGRVEVLKPDYITHTHVTVSVPGLSMFQLKYVLNWFKGKIRGQLILTYYPQPKHWLHVFLRPHNTDVHKLLKKGSKRIEGAFETNLKHGHKYSLTCEDEEQPQRPQKVHSSDGLFLRHIFTDNPTFDIHLDKKTTNVKMQLTEKGTDKKVWEYDLPDLSVFESPLRIDRADFSETPRSVDGQDDSSEIDAVRFVNKHRKKLIEKVTLVDPIADDLKDFIKDEKYDEIRKCNKRQDQMRMLYKFLTVEDLKIRFYESLQEHEPYLVEELKKLKGS